MKEHICSCTCGEIHQTHWCAYCWSEPPGWLSNKTAVLLFRAVQSLGTGEFAPGLESVGEQHLPWILKPYKALYGSPEDEWGIFCVLLVTQVASNYFSSQKKNILEVCVCHIGRLKSLKVGNCVTFILLASDSSCFHPNWKCNILINQHLFVQEHYKTITLRQFWELILVINNFSKSFSQMTFEQNHIVTLMHLLSKFVVMHFPVFVMNVISTSCKHILYIFHNVFRKS